VVQVPLVAWRLVAFKDDEGSCKACCAELATAGADPGGGNADADSIAGVPELDELDAALLTPSTAAPLFAVPALERGGHVEAGSRLPPPPTAASPCTQAAAIDVKSTEVSAAT